MSEYRAIYKCRMCGEEFEENKVNRNIAHAITVIFGVGTPDAFEVPFTNETVYKIIAHDCKDDSYGLADFVGFRKVEDGNEPDRKMEKPRDKEETPGRKYPSER